MADLIEKIVEVIINRQTKVPSMKSFSELLFVDTFDPAGTTFATKRVLVIGDPEELIKAGLTTTSVAYKAALKHFSQKPHIGKLYVGCKYPTDTSWTNAMSAIKKANNNFYAVATSARTMDEQQEIAEWIEANKKLYSIASGDDLIIEETTGNIASWLKLFNMDRSFVFYHPACAPTETGKLKISDDVFPDVAICASCLTWNPGSATWVFKDMAAVPTYEVDNSQFETAKANNAMLYCSVSDVPTTFFGTVGSGEYIDVIHGCDWLEARIQNKVFTDLKKSKKVPFNDTGIEIIKGALKSALQEGIDVAELIDSYEITAPEKKDVPEDQRAKRDLSGVAFTAPLSGAIHTARIRGTITL